MTMSLADIAKTPTLRFDVKQSESRFRDMDSYLDSIDTFLVGDVLPRGLIKGGQPTYTEDTSGSVPVISTASIQDMALVREVCRYTNSPDWGAKNEKKPITGDILLTMDGGVSIGKPLLFDFDEDFTVDSHVAILRPVGVDAALLVYLLASPIGQAQFQRAESGASGQTAVNEDDIRRIRLPRVDPLLVQKAVSSLSAARQVADTYREKARGTEEQGWAVFLQQLTQ
jgi:hypothetical protein